MDIQCYILYVCLKWDIKENSMNSDLYSLFESKSVFFLDGDGTLYVDDHCLPGSVEFLNLLKKHQKTFFICTNNSSKSPIAYFEKFRKMGLPVELDQIITSAVPAVYYLKSQHIKHVYWVANKTMSEYLIDQGLVFTDVNPEACLLTYDTELTYEKLVTLCSFLRKGLPYFVTHLDRLCPSKEGGLPDVGLFVNLIHDTVSRLPDRVFGKPSQSMITPILDDLGKTLADSVMVGDRLYTDIQMGKHSDLTTVLTLTGEATLDDLDSLLQEDKPTIVIPDLNTWVRIIENECNC